MKNYLQVEQKQKVDLQTLQHKTKRTESKCNYDFFCGANFWIFVVMHKLTLFARSVTMNFPG